jgi:hypothetical protein
MAPYLLEFTLFIVGSFESLLLFLIALVLFGSGSFFYYLFDFSLK